MQDNDFEKDIITIGKIPIVENLLDVVCQTTKMGFAAIARVTDERWIVCSVRDDISFGLTPGDELELKTTICNEIRQHKNPVIINHVAEDPEFKKPSHPAAIWLSELYFDAYNPKRRSFFWNLMRH